jgi:hypothetical protein
MCVSAADVDVEEEYGLVVFGEVVEAADEVVMALYLIKDLR